MNQCCHRFASFSAAVLRMRCGASLILGVALPLLSLSTIAQTRVKLVVDATEVTRKIVHARLTLTAKPGIMHLVYPKWIPADHKPNGPITDLTGLQFTANGKPLVWRRDSVDMYAFEIQVPIDANQIEANLDLVGPPDGQIMHLGLSTSTQLMVLNWYQVLLYPEGLGSDNVQFSASIRLPQEWKFGTALPVESNRGDVVNFQPVTLTTLVDSPLIAGRHFREVDVTPPGEGRPHFVDIAGDSEAALAIPEEVFTHFRRLVSETGALFGARHYNSYHFLVALQGEISEGDEHHQSSDNRLPEMGLVDPEWRILHGALFAHEMTHSWIGKYRRPTGLATSDYQQPMKGDLLWVYEGLTSYLGRVLAARSGFLTSELTRDAVAGESAALTALGRTWRPLSDTTVAAQLLYDAPEAWSSWRRGVDFYPEGFLLWLEVDTIIRKGSRGTKSLDDFCRRFAGGPSGPPTVVPYTFDDVVANLNAVLPYDWKNLLDERLSSLSPRPPLNGVEQSGWDLVYVEKPTEFGHIEESLEKHIDMQYSLGIILSTDGELLDTAEGGPAARAGAVPGMKLIGVNNRVFTPDVIRQEVELAKGQPKPIELLVTSGQYFVTLRVDYHGGAKYPRLKREESHPDVLSDILRARVPSD
jgi:predicted metalloprotease with PDZ domain